VTESSAVRLFLTSLEAVRKDGTGWTAKCPAHADDKNSLHVAEGDGGRVLLKCHAGCAVQDVVNKAGRSMADLFPPELRKATSGADGPTVGGVGRKPGRSFGEPTACYDYTDEQGALLFQVQRDAEKNFRQRRPSHLEPPADPWIYDVRDVRKVPYRLQQLVVAVDLQARAKFDQPIFVVEGEKDVATLESFGLVATTNAGGAGKWTADHAKPFAGAKDVVVIPDADAPGLKHARAVAATLRPTGARVRILRLPDAREKADVTDWAAAGGTSSALLELVRTRTLPPGWTSVRGLIDTDMADVEWLMDGFVSAGSVTILSGDSAAWKSWVTWDIAVAMALGARWVGRFPTRKSRVMILSADEPLRETRRKLAWLVEWAAPNGTAAALATDICVHGLETELTDEDTLTEVQEAVAEFVPDIVFIDSMDATIAGDENKKEFSRAARMVVRALRSARPDVAVFFVHHWNKPSKERPNTPASRIRGFSGLRALCSHHLTMERSAAGAVATFTVDKNRHGKELPPFSLDVRIQESRGLACFEYAGDAQTPATVVNSPGAQRDVLEVIARRGSPILQSIIVKELAGKHHDKTVRRAIGALSFGKHPALKTERKGRDTLIVLAGAPGEQMPVEPEPDQAPEAAS